MSRDIEELTALNREYVASVQNSDVKRFDEILAADFYCSNPDKSLVDRTAFLKQTAIPVTIRNLTAHDVKIRVLGDFAIIHAATSYTTADGQQAHGRRTFRGRQQPVIAGLAPAIHPLSEKASCEDRWIPGSSPGHDE
jgi:ketosteroid isomerase-like protein